MNIKRKELRDEAFACVWKGGRYWEYDVLVPGAGKGQELRASRSDGGRGAARLRDLCELHAQRYSDFAFETIERNDRFGAADRNVEDTMKNSESARSQPERAASSHDVATGCF